jgi:UDP-N-acetylmuramyl tripeptide synthase
MTPVRTSLAAGAARAAGTLSRLAGRGGTSLPGKVLLRADPQGMRQLAGRLALGTAVISATNGKTTTAAMVAAILEQRGERLVHNRAGANMAGGVATALVDGHGDRGLFEVDEFWLDGIVADLRPRALLLANLFRDQLDRYGELETIAERWAAVAGSGAAQRLVLNADDPTVADLGAGRDDVLYFGVEDDSVALPALQHASDATHCRRCGAPYDYRAHYLGHLGIYRCPACGARRPDPQVAARDIAFDGVRGASFTLDLGAAGRERITLALPGLYNVYNALAAGALAHALGASAGEIAAGLHAVRAAFGRAERIEVGGRQLAILLIKNPAGANEVLRTLALEPGEHDLLGVLNDNVADGRDVSWIWDADAELLAGRVRTATCSGTRAPELAVRLKYAGVPVDRIVIEPDLARALDAALATGPTSTPLYALPTYTAMLALREELVARGAARGSFR